MTPDLIFILTKGQTLVEVPLSDGSLINVPQWKANGAPSLNAWVRQQTSGARTDLLKQSQGEPVVGLYGAVVGQAARALGYDDVEATNYHIRKWRIN